MIIAAVILLNSIVGVVQEDKARKAIEALKGLASPKALVRTYMPYWSYPQYCHLLSHILHPFFPQERTRLSVQTLLFSNSGLAAIVTIVLALSVSRMVKVGTIVRRLLPMDRCHSLSLRIKCPLIRPGKSFFQFSPLISILFCQIRGLQE